MEAGGLQNRRRGSAPRNAGWAKALRIPRLFLETLHPLGRFAPRQAGTRTLGPRYLGRSVSRRGDTPGWRWPPLRGPALPCAAAVTTQVSDGAGDSQCCDSGVNANEAGRNESN